MNNCQLAGQSLLNVSPAWSERNKNNITINSLYDPQRLAKAGFLNKRFKGHWRARYEKHLPLHTFNVKKSLTSSLLKSGQKSFSRYFLFSSSVTRPLQSIWVSQPRADSRFGFRGQMVTRPISNSGLNVFCLLFSMPGK